MAEESRTPLTEADVARRLDALQTQLVQADHLRRRLRTVGLLGVLLLLAVLLLFAYRLVDHALSYKRMMDDETARNQFMHEFMERTQVMNIIQAEGESFRRDIQEAIPDFGNKLMKAFEEKMPEIQKEAGDMADRLRKFVQVRVETRLANALSKAAQDADKEVKAIIPGFDFDQLAKGLDVAKQVYTERIHEILEEKLAFVAPSFEVFRDKAHKLAEREQVNKQTVEELQRRLIDVFIELVVYELKPELGEQLAVPAATPTPAPAPKPATKGGAR